MRISIVSEQLESLNEICELYKVIQRINFSTEIKFDFYKVNILGITGLMNLLLLSKYIIEQLKLKLIIVNLRIDIYRMLERSGILKENIINIDKDSIITEFDDLLNDSNSKIEYKNFKSFIPHSLRFYSVKSIKETKKLWRELDNILKIWFPEEEYRTSIDNVLTLVTEVVSNSLEHSSPTPNEGNCYVILEKRNKISNSYYNPLDLNKYQVKINIFDMGIGIKTRLERKYCKKYKNNFDYINFSLENGITGRTKEDYSYHNEDKGGTGLTLMKDVVKNFEGNFSFRSSGGLVCFDLDTKKEELDLNFMIEGTQIEITLNYNKIKTLTKDKKNDTF